MTTITVADLINSAVDAEPSTFKDHFNQLMMDKVYDAVQEKKAQFAKNMFGDQEVKSAEEDATEVTQGENDGQDA